MALRDLFCTNKASALRGSQVMYVTFKGGKDAEESAALLCYLLNHCINAK